jgi:hypothetical protein
MRLRRIVRIKLVLIATLAQSRTQSIPVDVLNLRWDIAQPGMVKVTNGEDDVPWLRDFDATHADFVAGSTRSAPSISSVSYWLALCGGSPGIASPISVAARFGRGTDIRSLTDALLDGLPGFEDGELPAVARALAARCLVQMESAPLSREAWTERSTATCELHVRDARSYLEEAGFAETGESVSLPRDCHVVCGGWPSASLITMPVLSSWRSLAVKTNARILTGLWRMGPDFYSSAQTKLDFWDLLSWKVFHEIGQYYVSQIVIGSLPSVTRDETRLAVRIIGRFDEQRVVRYLRDVGVSVHQQTGGLRFDWSGHDIVIAENAARAGTIGDGESSTPWTERLPIANRRPGVLYVRGPILSLGSMGTFTEIVVEFARQGRLCCHVYLRSPDEAGGWMAELAALERSLRSSTAAVHAEIEASKNLAASIAGATITRKGSMVSVETPEGTIQALVHWCWTRAE